jgi:OOP family OmpA-OmpF porin
MKKHILAASLLAAVALPAAADGFYIAGDLGQSKFSGEDGGNDTAFAAGVGYNINSTFSAELSYHDLGGIGISSTEYDPRVGYIDIDGTIKATAAALSAIAKLPVNDSFGVYARLGYSQIKLKADATGSAMGITVPVSTSDSANKAIYGLGADYKLNEKAALRAEYIKFNDTDITSLTVGFSYAF